jgi:hypothetical protein
MEVHGGLISYFFSCLSIKPLLSIILDSHTCQTNPVAAKMQVSGIKLSHPPLGVGGDSFCQFQRSDFFSAQTEMDEFSDYHWNPAVRFRQEHLL